MSNYNRLIRIRCGPLDFCLYNTHWDFMASPFIFNDLLTVQLFITASYADQHKTTSWNGFKASLPDYEHTQDRVGGHEYTLSSS